MTALEKSIKELRREVADLKRQLTAAQSAIEAMRSSSGSSASTSTPATPPKKTFDRQQYASLVARVRESAASAIPDGATVLVVSKGDEELLKIPGRLARHFPQVPSGAYAGHYPADSAAAIAHLESLRATGAEFIVFPATAFWWLEHYAQLRDHLSARYSAVLHRDDTCIVYRLGDVSRPSAARSDHRDPAKTQYEGLIAQIRALVAALLPAGAKVAVVSKGDEHFLQLGNGIKARHFPESPTGGYAGHHPADSADAIARLETIRRQGVQYLLLPSTMSWWLKHYADFTQHLEKQHQAIVHQPHIGVIYELNQAVRATAPIAQNKFRQPGHAEYAKA